MPFTIETDDGIIIEDIPDNIAPDSDILRQRVATIRQQRDSGQTVENQIQEELTAGGIASGSLDLARTIIETPLRKATGGIAGLAGAAFGEEGEALRDLEEVQAAQTPLSPEGQQVARSIGEKVQEAGQFISDITPQPVKEVVETVGEFGGQVIDVVQEKRNQALNFINEKFGPGAATAVDLATDPEAIFEIVVGLGPAKRLLNIGTTKADDIVDSTNDALRQEGIRTTKTELPPEAKDYETLVDDIRKGREQKVAQQVLPDQEILDSAERLNVDLNPSHYSTNRAFIEVEQAIKSTTPGSKLGDVEAQAIKATGKAADDLVLDLSGDVDKSLTDLRVKTDVQSNIAKLNTQSEKAYGIVNRAIPRPTKVNPTDSRAYIQTRLDDLGGDESLLSTAEKQLKRLTDPESNPTYGALDQVRRNVGEALGKNRGPFQDDDRAILDQMYGVLSNDQQGVADIMGVGAEYALGRKLVFGRKNLEKKAIELFGKKMNDSILPKIRQAAGKLTKGDVSQINKLMNALPPSRRQEVAATLLNEIFTAGSRQGTDLGQGFVNAFASLNRNKGAMDVLFKHLPKGSRKRFNDIGRVSTGIFKSKAFQNNSKTAIGNSLVRSMDDGSFAGKIFDKAFDIATGAAVGSIIPGVGGFTGAALNLIRTARGGSKLQAGDALLSSPGFKRSIQDALEGNMGKSNTFTEKAVFKNWLKVQNQDVKDAILAVGFVPWLVGNDPRLSLTLQEAE